MARHSAPLLLAGLVAACGGTVTGAGSDGGAGAGGSGGSGGNGCSRTQDAVEMSIDAFGGQTFDCGTSADGGVPAWSSTATVTAVDATSLTLDGCSPYADCIPMISTVHVSAPGLSLSVIPVGSVVHVDYAGGFSMWACARRIAITSASWSPDPAPPPRLYLAVSDGTANTAAPEWFSVGTTRLACSAEEGSGCGGPKPGDYTLDFTTAAGAPTLSVKMGETATWQLDANNSVRVRNLRSFQTAICDDYWNWAYWVAP